MRSPWGWGVTPPNPWRNTKHTHSLPFSDGYYNFNTLMTTANSSSTS